MDAPRMPLASNVARAALCAASTGSRLAQLLQVDLQSPEPIKVDVNMRLDDLPVRGRRARQAQ